MNLPIAAVLHQDVIGGDAGWRDRDPEIRKRSRQGPARFPKCVDLTVARAGLRAWMLPYPLPGRIYGQARIGMKYAVFQSVKVLALRGPSLGRGREA